MDKKAVPVSEALALIQGLSSHQIKARYDELVLRIGELEAERRQVGVLLRAVKAREAEQARNKCVADVLASMNSGGAADALDAL